MYVIVDANNFFASCELAFQPWNVGKPVGVLTNNDHCIIARSKELKKLGVKMGTPVFQIQELIKKHNVILYSSNYTLYNDMSKRIMSILFDKILDMEVYSIDETFGKLPDYENEDWREYCLKLVREVTLGVGVPISMGVAPTKTLTKVAIEFAKKYKGYQGVCVIDTEEKRIKALQLTKLRDIWGIGDATEEKLIRLGVKNAYEFTQLNQKLVRKRFTVVGERMYLELKGISCIELEDENKPKKQLKKSISFGQFQTEYEGLREAVASHALVCAQRLRKQKSCAVTLRVYIHTNSFNKKDPQYFNSYAITLPVPSNTDFEINHYAQIALKEIFVEGYRYKKACVEILEIVPEESTQLNIYIQPKDDKKQRKIMATKDMLNRKYDKQVITLAVSTSQTASEEHKTNWHMQRNKKSPDYTTDIRQVIQINCR